jgi:hypothetical protein
VRKIGSLPKELMVNLEQRIMNPDWRKEGRELVLAGKKPTLVRGGH